MAVTSAVSYFNGGVAVAMDKLRRNVSKVPAIKAFTCIMN